MCASYINNLTKKTPQKIQVDWLPSSAFGKFDFTDWIRAEMIDRKLIGNYSRNRLIVLVTFRAKNAKHCLLTASYL